MQSEVSFALLHPAGFVNFQGEQRGEQGLLFCGNGAAYFSTGRSDHPCFCPLVLPGGQVVLPGGQGVSEAPDNTISKEESRPGCK